MACEQTEPPLQVIDHVLSVRCACGEGACVLLSDAPATLCCTLCGTALLDIDPVAGWVYVLTNPLIPGYLKIGQTQRSVAERVAELSSASGVPAPFHVRAVFATDDPVGKESQIHAKLAPKRVEGREFFEVDVATALATCEAICGAAPVMRVPASAHRPVEASPPADDPELAQLPSTDSPSRRDGTFMLARKGICPKCYLRMRKLRKSQGWLCRDCRQLFDPSGSRM